MPNMPDLLTGPPEDPESVSLALPDNSSVPLPQLAQGVDLTQGVAAVVPGGFCVGDGVGDGVVLFDRRGGMALMHFVCSAMLVACSSRGLCEGGVNK